MKRLITFSAAVILLSAASALASDERTAFRGLSLGMSKDAIMSSKIDDFRIKTAAAIKSGKELIIPARVELLSSDGQSCATASLDEAENSVVNLTMKECFFGSKGARVRDFAQKFADSYNVETLIGSKGPRNKALEEKYEGETEYGEAIKITQLTVSGVPLPVQVFVNMPLGGAKFN